MLKKIRIKNFKCYGDRPADFNLSKVNFIFGDNGAGKSTFLQLLDILCNFWEHDIISNYEKYAFRGDVTRTIEAKMRLVNDLTQKETMLDFKVTQKEGRSYEGGTKEDTAAFRALLPHSIHSEASRPDSTEPTASAGFSSLKDERFKNSIMSSRAKEYSDQILTDLNLGFSRVDNDTLLDTVFGVKVPFMHVGAGIHSLVRISDCLYKWRFGNTLTQTPAGGILSIEEPETHVNERQLALLAKVLVKEGLAAESGQLLVECHSELMMLELLNLVRFDVIKPQELAVLVVSKTPDGSVVSTIDIDATGHLLTPWPGGFFPARMTITDDFFKGIRR
ncbi:AAA family ATPase [bacterium]|nr:AAA family ATPase [bacterium]MBP1589654.1 AAA family ATPase [Kiritimatiellia bacterium]